MDLQLSTLSFGKRPLSPSNDPPQPKFGLSLFPRSTHPYFELIRFEKPTGTILMFWPFAWGLTMGAYNIDLPLGQYSTELAKCLCAAFIVRSCACTVNDIFDRDMDAGVERTKGRPLPSGRISVLAATVYLLIQYSIGIGFLYGTLRALAFTVALFQLLPLFAIYPLLKRVTYWPQAWLGICMNFGFATAWIATTGRIDYPVIIFSMIGAWCWTMVYDTIYACQDIKDDVKMGVRSTAILFGSWIRPLLMGCAVAFVLCLGAAGYMNNQGLPYYVLSVGGTACHLIWQFTTVDLDVPSSCGRNFQRNGHLGWFAWGGVFADYLLRSLYR